MSYPRKEPDPIDEQPARLTPQKLLDFTGRVVIVTGAGQGIGAGIARRFAQAGAPVVVNYRTSAEGAQVVVARIEAEGGEAAAVQADVSREEGAIALIEAAVARFGRVDGLINNAGTYPLHNLLDMTAADWDAVIDANQRSAFLCTQAAARRMIEQGEGGTIVNITSIEAEHPAPAHSHYNAAKAAVAMFTRSAALELGPHGIRVNAVAPGLIWREGLDEDWPDGVARYRAAAPLGRLGTYDDVADACLFLASPAARWITGVTLRVDGGVMASPIY
jgi:NAD(P)-dependent dehydrogenase (short-subunit alcohol dehydrogenase family)